MRLKSLRPWRVPSASVSVFGTPSGSLATLGGMFHAIQCVHVPAGASGSSAIRANDCAPAGALDHVNSGEASLPSHVNFFGIVPPSENALLRMPRFITPPPDAFERLGPAGKAVVAGKIQYKSGSSSSGEKSALSFMGHLSGELYNFRQLRAG